MEESILKSIKELLGPDSAYDVFDNGIVIFINGVFATLNQLGVGPEEGFRITGEDETWNDFLGDSTNMDSVKNYVYMKVRLIFDPPSSSSVMSAYEEACKELEWRLCVAAESNV